MARFFGLTTSAVWFELEIPRISVRLASISNLIHKHKQRPVYVGEKLSRSLSGSISKDMPLKRAMVELGTNKIYYSAHSPRIDESDCTSAALRTLTLCSLRDLTASSLFSKLKTRTAFFEGPCENAYM